ncbi:Regulator of nonsense transcripts 2 [Fasciola gigantica]|uniref:Regulator of nonsense transcripts 2 n=1 Tax=Fasciola gigantica TaxID=46835 RepID=A0A504XMT3_FASGI|nr:Regulator of nonsense transcripts 2 [Fasciola gigantica]
MMSGFNCSVLSAKYNKSVPRSSFMPAERQAKCRALFHDYLEGARRFLQNMVKDAKKIVSANRNMMETRGEVSEDRQERADRLVSGCRKFHESLTTLADLLDVDPPSEFSCMLKEALKADDVDAVEPDENDTHIGVQLFEDEDTRLFYESLPDIKAMVPGILYKDSEQAKSESSRDRSEDEGGNLEDIDVEALESELAREEEEVSKNSEDSTSAINVTDRDKPPTMLGIDETEEDPNSSGKILMETFLTQLPNCVNRDLIDRAAVNFCLTLNKRSNRRRLARALLMVPRTRYDLLPFYARLVAALAPVMPDLVQDVNTMLTGEFQWRVSKRDQLNLESKLKIVRFIGELVKFRIYPAHQALACLKKLLPQFVHHNIEMACALLDTCGRFLYRSSSSHLRTKVYLEVMLRKKKALHMDQRYTIMIENTYYYCNPPSASRQLVPTVVLTPTMQFLRRLLWRDLDRTTVNSVLRLIRKIDWNDTELVQFTEVLFTRAWEVRYTNINCLASILSGLAVFHRSFAMAVVDNVIEDVRVGMELNLPHLNQRRISMVKYLGLLYNYCLVDSPVIFKTLYSLLTFGVSLDNNVFSILDPPDSLFRITLICTLLETSGGFFDLGKKRRKLNIFLAYFQRYYWFKRSQPIWEQPQTAGSVRSDSADPIPLRSTANQTSTNATLNGTQNTAGDLTQKSDEQTASVENGTDAPGSVTQSDKLPVFTPLPFPSGVEQMYAETLAQLRIKVFRATNLSQAVRLVNQLETRYLPRLARLKATYGLVDDGDAINTADNELRNQTPRATCPGRMDPIAEESEQNEEIQMDDEDYVVDDDDDDDDDEDDDEDDDAEREEGRGRRNWRHVQTDQPEPDGIRRRGSQQEQKSDMASRTDQMADGDTKLKPSTSDEDQTQEPFEDEEELAVRMGLKPRYIDCPEDAEFREALDRMTAEALLSTGPASGPGVGGSSGAVTGTPDGGPLRQSTASALPAPDILQLSATRTRPLGTQSSTPSAASTGKPSTTIPEHTISLLSAVKTKPDESCLFIEAQDESQPTLDSDEAQNTVVFSLITRRGNRPHMVPLAVPETVQFAARFMQAEAAEREEKARMKQLVLEMHEAQKEEEMEWGHFGSQERSLVTTNFALMIIGIRMAAPVNHPKGAPDADAVFGTSSQRR